MFLSLLGQVWYLIVSIPDLAAFVTLYVLMRHFILQLPTFKHESVVVNESNAICFYLEVSLNWLHVG